jgi:putative spermidine/putrescine transport system permease protein
MRALSRRLGTDIAAPYLLCLPLVLFLAAWFLLPVGRMMLLSVTPDTGPHWFTFQRFAGILGDSYDRGLIYRTLRVSLWTTAISLVTAYPVALLLRGLNSRAQAILVLIMVSPLLTSVVVRTLAWVALLSRSGIVNQALTAVGLPPIEIMYTETGVVVGLTHVFLGYMIISLLTSLRRIDENLYAAASNLGASRFRMLLEITLPLSLPGVLAGCVLVFTLSAGAYATPSLLGGSRASVLPVEIYNLAIQQLAWGDAAAAASVLFLLIAVVTGLATRIVEGGRRRVIFQ